VQPAEGLNCVCDVGHSSCRENLFVVGAGGGVRLQGELIVVGGGGGRQYWLKRYMGAHTPSFTIEESASCRWECRKRPSFNSWLADRWWAELNIWAVRRVCAASRRG